MDSNTVLIVYGGVREATTATAAAIFSIVVLVVAKPVILSSFVSHLASNFRA